MEQEWVCRNRNGYVGQEWVCRNRNGYTCIATIIVMHLYSSIQLQDLLVLLVVVPECMHIIILIVTSVIIILSGL